MKTAEIASAPPQTWNRKNLPSDIERFEETSGEGIPLLGNLPGTAMRFVRQRRGIVLLSLAALAGFGLVWYLSKRE